MTTTIIRAPHDKEAPYTVISNACLTSGLSLKALGLLTYMLSKPDDWSFSLDCLVYHLNEGRSAVKSAMKELELKGHVVKKQRKDGKGLFTKLSLTVYEAPSSLQSEFSRSYRPLTETSLIETSSSENPSPVYPLMEHPLSENLLTDNPLTENPRVLSNNIINNNLTNAELPVAIAPSVCLEKIAFQEGSPKETTTPAKQGSPQKPPIKPEEGFFNRWYEAYPRHVARKPAFKAFAKAIKTIPFETLLDLTQAYARSVEDKDKQYVPYPATWLSQELWEDLKVSALPASSARLRQEEPHNPVFDVLLKKTDVPRHLLRETWIERKGETLFVNSPSNRIADGLLVYRDDFRDAYQTQEICFRAYPQGENAWLSQ